jgi:MFS family permease
VAIVATEFPRPAERATAMSVYTFVAVAGGTIGLLLGGVIVDSLDWHWILFINVPIGIVTWLLGRALIEESEPLGLEGGVDVLGDPRHGLAHARRLRDRHLPGRRGARATH